ncbi:MULTISPECIES: hypothetical protein [unclassified Flavobacterium]|uniref:hypothetical protein n=1 Tax=unclassified Flavobacterium TaxID=196869 RepID=UPI00095C5DEE|nr:MULTISPECIES: hypothetical protein [unclassified Flavobacterium]MBN9284102.1 hypothetical protein [Flavobacterium sp.]OJV71117.1 MAG: hypothetical protein BGO42_04705 [Flavobacterium sp. 40-81]
MTKQPMTPTGVDDKIKELYLLSNAALQTEALAIQADFKTWIKDNFILSTKQEDYLDDLNTQTSTYFGSQSSICFSNRLPIELIYPAPPVGEHSKWTGSSNNLAVKSDGSAKPIATGTLTFEFSYT